MRHIVRLTEIAAQFRRYAEDGQKIVRHAPEADALRLDIAGGAGQICIVAAEQSKISETALAGAPIKIIRQANRTGIEDSCALANEHEAVRLRIRQGPQEHRVNNAENGSIGTDPERERDDRDSCKSGRLTKLAESEFEIVHIIQCAKRRLDRRATRGVPESRTPGMWRRKEARRRQCKFPGRSL